MTSWPRLPGHGDGQGRPVVDTLAFGAPGHAHTLLIRRSVNAPSEAEFFLAHAPAGTAVTELIDAAGMRWKIEENNEHGKDLLGLTQYQVRKWTPWHRHVTIAMLALAFLAVTRHPADRH